MLEEKRLENQELAQKVAGKFMESEDLRTNLAIFEDRCGRLQGSLDTKALEHQNLGIKLSQTTQALTEAQNEIQNISSKLLQSNEQLDEREKKLHSLCP